MNGFLKYRLSISRILLVASISFWIGKSNLLGSVTIGVSGTETERTRMPKISKEGFDEVPDDWSPKQEFKKMMNK